MPCLHFCDCSYVFVLCLFCVLLPPSAVLGTGGGEPVPLASLARVVGSVSSLTGAPYVLRQSEWSPSPSRTTGSAEPAGGTSTAPWPASRQMPGSSDQPEWPRWPSLWWEFCGIARGPDRTRKVETTRFQPGQVGLRPLEPVSIFLPWLFRKAAWNPQRAGLGTLICF